MCDMLYNEQHNSMLQINKKDIQKVMSLVAEELVFQIHAVTVTLSELIGNPKLGTVGTRLEITLVGEEHPPPPCK